MTFRLCCIFEMPQTRTLYYTSPSEEACVQAMERNGLCAVCLEVSDIAEPHDISKPMQHYGVIKSLFDRITVIPFRFDTLLENRADLEILLETRGDYYRRQLKRLDGCVEMGIRAMVDGLTTAPKAAPKSGEVPRPEASNPGRLYLWNRKSHYADESMLAEKHEEVSEKFRASFAGTFKDFRSEAARPATSESDPDTMMISLYFLVPKDLLVPFRQQFGAMAATKPSKLLLTGPWPPYNFVLPDDPQAKHSRS
ncbi:MAG: GvpL/GvpF family gas vesicle protein [Pseudomonadota bacterium]